MNAPGRSRRTLILDAAEHLFSQRGYDGVSVRMVADAAPVGLGLVTHHFPSKDILFEAVVARRAEALNAARWQALQDLAADASLEDLLRAFVEPYRTLIEEGEPGWRAYARLIALMTQDPRWTDLAAQHFGGIGQAFIARMRAAEPRLNADSAVRAYVHLVGLVMAMFAATGLLDRFSDRRLSSTDLSASVGPLVIFAAAGVRALAASD